jgi:hypothetical protein
MRQRRPLLRQSKSTNRSPVVRQIVAPFGFQSEESLLSLRCHRITMVQPAESR